MTETRKKEFPLIRISEELKSELDEAKNTLFPFRTSYNDILSLLPRCPNCSSLLFKRVKEDDTLTCWKCHKKFRLEEVA